MLGALLVSRVAPPTPPPVLTIALPPPLPFPFFRTLAASALLHNVGDAVLPLTGSLDPDDGGKAQQDLLLQKLQKECAARKFELLSHKEKKELRAYAHGLGKKIVSLQVGKSGVTASLARAASNLLEANEILKLKVLGNCPDDVEEVTRKIEEVTQAQVVGKIGNVVLFYRPSLRKSTLSGKQQNKELQSQRRVPTSKGGRRE